MNKLIPTITIGLAFSISGCTTGDVEVSPREATNVSSTSDRADEGAADIDLTENVPSPPSLARRLPGARTTRAVQEATGGGATTHSGSTGGKGTGDDSPPGEQPTSGAATHSGTTIGKGTGDDSPPGEQPTTEELVGNSLPHEHGK